MARWFVDRSAHRGIPSVSLRRLLPEARFLGCPDLVASGCTADSRRLDPGQVFVALRGSRHDGHAFVSRALERGAAGVVVERPCPEAGPLQVVVPDAREALARLCQALAGDPSEQLRVLGLTGRDGQTATALFLRSILEAAGERVGLIGPEVWSDGLETRPAGASASAEGLAEMLAALVERRCSTAIVEVPPAALEKRTIAGIAFEAALVNRLAGDSPENVQADRSRVARLFRQISPGGSAVVNADDPEAELLGAVNLEARRVAYSLTGPADVSARIEWLDTSGSRFRLRGFDREATVTIRPIGAAAVGHALAAAALGWSRGLPLDTVVAGLESVSSLPGRLEAVDQGQDFSVWLDRARTGPELAQALATLRELNPRRLLVVVGADGFSDRPDRLDLARAAEAGADQVVLTLSHPRAEDPDRLLDDVLSGFSRPGRVLVQPDRRLALSSALSLASPGDSLLIAGKGDQPFQILAHRPLPLDDRAIASDWLAHHHSPARRRSA